MLTVVAGYLEAMAQVRHTPFEEMAQIVAEETGQPLDVSSQQLQDRLTIPPNPVDGRCDTQVIEFTRSVLAATSPEFADVDVSKVCDNSYLDKLKEMGYQKMLGLPGY
jgi:hypothetical protein